MNTIVRELGIEAEAAKSLLANIREIIADDDEASSDAVEGETNLFEVVKLALMRIAELDAHCDGIKAHIDAMKSRQHRFEKQAEALRNGIVSAMEEAGLKKIERDIATVSLRPSPQKVVITNEADIPSTFWKEPPPVVDKRAILDALKAKQPVPGAELSNQSTSVQIRWK